jgi:pyruvate/2-oxoglutarate/acetoin dehydrogenase E1 component
LRAVERLGAPRAPVPFSPALEDAMRISPARVAAAMQRVAAT